MTEDYRVINALFDKANKSLSAAREALNATGSTERTYSILSHARNDMEVAAEYVFHLLREEQRLEMIRRTRRRTHTPTCDGPHD